MPVLKRFSLLYIAMLLFNPVFSQTKPILPADYYSTFNYAYPKNLDINDATALHTAMSSLSAVLLRWDSIAFANYRIPDSSTLYSMLDAYAASSSVAGHYTTAVDAILQCRRINPSPVYTLPFRLIQLAYNRACILHDDDSSNAFQNAFTQTLHDEFDRLLPDFKNDIVNQTKGSFTAGSTEKYRQDLKDIFDQTAGMMDHENAVTCIITYQLYQVRKNYQALIEQLLYAIAPAKVKELNVKIPMRDGIKLNAYVYLNETDHTPQPAVVSLSPYPGGNEATKGNVFATNGYVYLYVDTRGRRESEGHFMPYEDDARDFYDIIDWASKQPWCNGKVATSGGSYLGFDQWQTIRKGFKHPALKAINPMVAVGFGIDFPRSNQMFYPYILQWATFVSGKDLNVALFQDSKFWNDKAYAMYKNHIPFAKFDSVAGLPNPVFQKWVSHPTFDEYWKNILPEKEDYAAIDIPIFTITGYYDADQNGAMYYYNQHMKYGTAKAKAQHFMLIGPYEHGASQWQPGPVQYGMSLEKEAQIPIYKYVIWWFDWVLKGKAKPAFIKDKITYYETGMHQWKGAQSFQSNTTDSLVLYLKTGFVPNAKRNTVHSLSLQPSAGDQTITYSHDIAMAIDSSFLFANAKPFDDSLYLASPYNIVFESAPLQNDIVLSNKIITRLYAALNVPDADFEIFVDEVAPDGKDYNIAYDNMRIRYRNGGEHAQLAQPGKIMELNFNNAFVYIKKIPKGSRIRLIFQSMNNTYSEKNYGFGGEVSRETTSKPRLIEATIQISKKYPSKIIFPYRKN
ncbi:MAG: CocE/NonD family hydrolase [Bacteroidetes bacterium]|nr:CocE/NonD family hydrolase [Bacteroidota bacterium]